MGGGGVDKLDKNPAELFDWMKECAAAYQPTRGSKERSDCESMLYNEGIQWIASSPELSRIDRIKQALDIDSPSHRPTNNQTTRLIQLVEAATAIRQFECEVIPPVRDVGVESSVRGQTYEDFLGLLLKDCRLVDAWNHANYMRCVVGAWGIGCYLQPTITRLGGSEVLSVNDSEMRAFNYNPLLLTLDPATTARNLENHEWVMYSAAWSHKKIERLLSPMLKKLHIEMDPTSMKSIGELSPFESNLNRISHGRLYSSARQDSQTKGAIVHEVYRKVNSTVRFDEMLLVLELPDQQMHLLNPDMRSSPWGGVGIGLRLLQGYRRAEGMWGIGDVQMVKNRQDSLNRNELMLERQLRNASKDQLLVDRKAFGSDNTDEAIRRKITNAVSGVIPWDSGTESNRAMPPSVLQRRPVDSFLTQRNDSISAEMREQIHRAAIHQGEVQTHTPLGAYQLALEEAGAPADRRVLDDKLTGESLAHTILATGLKLVQDGSPAMAQRLVNAGFSDTDLGTLAEGEAPLLSYSVMVREGSIRQRSLSAKVQGLREDAKSGVLSPDQYRSAMAESGIDMPLTEEDATYSRWSERIARDVMLGAEYKPKPLVIVTGMGTVDQSRSVYLIQALTRAMVDRRCTPEGEDRLIQAIELQRQKDAQDLAMAQASAQPAVEPQAPGPVGAGGMDSGMGMQDIIASLEAQGAGGRAVA